MSEVIDCHATGHWTSWDPEVVMPLTIQVCRSHTLGIGVTIDWVRTLHPDRRDEVLTAEEFGARYEPRDEWAEEVNPIATLHWSVYRWAILGAPRRRETCIGQVYLTPVDLLATRVAEALVDYRLIEVASRKWSGGYLIVGEGRVIHHELHGVVK